MLSSLFNFHNFERQSLSILKTSILVLVLRHLFLGRIPVTVGIPDNSVTSPRTNIVTTEKTIENIPSPRPIETITLPGRLR